MASVTPRFSGLWRDDYFSNDNNDEAMGMGIEDDDVERQELDGRTPLDRTIDRIGMGESSVPSSLRRPGVVVTRGQAGIKSSFLRSVALG